MSYEMDRLKLDTLTITTEYLKRLNDKYLRGRPLNRWDIPFDDSPAALFYNLPEPPPSKCPSCGSREFRQHAGRSVCSYCRSES